MWLDKQQLQQSQHWQQEKNWKLQLLDIKTIFFNKMLKEEVYMFLSLDFEEKESERKVY